MSAPLSSPGPPRDPLQTHSKSGYSISPKKVSFGIWHALAEQVFSPPGTVLSFSEPHSIQMRPHVAFEHITPVPWKAALRWYRIKSTEIWFVFPVIIRSLVSESVQLRSPGNQVLLCPSRNLTQPLLLWKAL